MDADLFDRLWNFTLLLGLFNFLLFTYFIGRNDDR